MLLEGKTPCRQDAAVNCHPTFTVRLTARGRFGFKTGLGQGSALMLVRGPLLGLAVPAAETSCLAARAFFEEAPSMAVLALSEGVGQAQDAPAPALAHLRIQTRAK